MCETQMWLDWTAPVGLTLNRLDIKKRPAVGVWLV